MTALSIAAALLLANSCQNAIAPATVVAIAKQESGLDPTAVHQNRGGSIDVGLMQVNSRNFPWLGLTVKSALDPCRSIAAGVAVLTHLSQYNSGSPTRSLPYAMAVSAQIDTVRAGDIAPNSPHPPSSAAEGNADLDDRPADTDGETVFEGY